MSTTAKPVSKSKINKLPQNKAKRGIFSNANAGSSGGPEVDVKAWKAAQKAAASGSKGAEEEEEKKKQERTKRFAVASEVAAACESSAKQALKAVEGVGGKKEEVVKGYVNQGAKKGAQGAESTTKQQGAESVEGVAGVTKIRDTTKKPRQLLSEFCQKQKLGKPSIVTLQDKNGFKAKFILHKDGGDPQVRVTDRSYATAQEAQEAAAVWGLYCTAGDRRMDRIMGAEYAALWKEVEAAEAESKRRAEMAAKRKENEKKRENSASKDKFMPLYISSALLTKLENVLRSAVSSFFPSQGSGKGGCGEEERSKVLALGFAQEQVDRAMRACGEGGAELMIDWLCLHEDEGKLPEGLRTKGGNMPFEIIDFSKDRKSQKGEEEVGKGGKGREEERRSGRSSAAVSWEDATDVEILISLGFHEEASQSALQACDGEVQNALNHLLWEQQQGGGGGGEGEAESIAEEAEEEAQALSSIFGENFFAENGEWRVKVDGALGGRIEGLELSISLLGSSYPHSPPRRILVRGPTTPRAHQVWMSKELFDLSSRSVGGPVVFDLVSWLQSDEPLAILPARQEELSSLLSCRRSQQEADDLSEVSTEGSAEGSRGGSSTSVVKVKSSSGPSRSSAQRGGREQALNAEQVKQVSLLMKEQEEKKKSSPAWCKLQDKRRSLPAWKAREEIIEKLSKNQVLIISGETGCGKTTQVPQFILDDLIERGGGGGANIICTQPRRISALGVAERVAQERCEDVGGSIGYQIRLESKRSRQTRMLFCTTGILLRRMAEDRELSGVSHVMVDEVHERSVDSDFLLILLRRLIRKRKDIKIILMSATLDAHKFCKYFDDAPSLHIPGFTFPVEEFFLEDCFRITGQLIGRGSQYALARDAFLARKKEMVEAAKTGDVEKAVDQEIDSIPDEADPWGDETVNSVSEPADERPYDPNGRLTDVEISMLNVDESKINYEMIELLLLHISSSSAKDSKQDGSVLVFLPGMGEIQRAHDTLVDSSRLRQVGKFWFIPLHSSLPSLDQLKVFERPPPGVRKVILATNIAETSITIDDCSYVIDCGRSKQVAFDAETGLSRLLEDWISRAAAQQRRGRAGRVREGVCYRLFSRRLFHRMPEQQQPEIHRVPLTGLCLQIMEMQLGSAAAFLREALDPPSSKSIEHAMDTLYGVGAIQGGEKGKWLEQGALWRLTHMGEHLAKVPADVRLARMLMFGAVFGCVDPILTVAATMTSKSPFLVPFDKREEAMKRKQSFAHPRDKSDHLLFIRVFDEWTKARRRGAKEERLFCQTNFLSSSSLNTISDLREQFRELLSDAGFIHSRANSRVRNMLTYQLDASCNSNSDNVRLLRAVIAAGLYPHVIRVQLPETKFVEQAAGAIARAATAKELKLYTEKDGRVFLHPSSINFSEGDFLSPWLVYHDKQATSKVFIRDSSMVTPYALVLFGTDLRILHAAGHVYVDDWIKFRAPARLSVFLKYLRRLLQEALDDKLRNPEADISDHPAVSLLMDFLEFE